MKRVWTENSHLGSKARLRAEFIRTLNKTDLYILDAFAGDGRVWERVGELLPDHNITYLGIDKKKYPSLHKTFENLKGSGFVIFVE